MYFRNIILDMHVQNQSSLETIIN